MVIMTTSRREKARRVVIAYVIVGFAFLSLYHFILSPAYPGHPILVALFYVFLPAFLAAPAALCVIIEDELPRLVDRFRKKDDEF